MYEGFRNFGKRLSAKGEMDTTFEEVHIIVHFSIVLSVFRVLLLAVSPPTLLYSKWGRFAVEYAALIVPMLLICTVFADQAALIFGVTLVCSVAAILMLPSQKNKKISQNPTSSSAVIDVEAKEFQDDDFDASKEDWDGFSKESDTDGSFLTAPVFDPNRVPGILLFRSWTTVISCICILAVDFYIFPRRLMKRNNYGNGLMDTGVGLFIVANGIVSPEARSKFRHSYTFKGKLTVIRSAILSSWPLWGVGFGRVFFVKFLGYHYSVSEYGVYWNFFFTLAAVRIFSAAILAFFSISWSLVLSVAFISVYQVFLVHPAVDITRMIFYGNRNGFFMENKDGICSCFGFVSLYFASVSLGSFLFRGGRTSVISWVKVCSWLILMGVVTWSITALATVYIQPVSRRLANLAYVTWIFSITVNIITMALIVDFFLIFCVRLNKIKSNLVPEQCMTEKMTNSKIKPMCLLTAVNQNQFLYFMISNFSTGLINLSVDTYSISNGNYSILILLAYMFFNLLLVWILHIKEIRVKFW